MSVAEIFNTMDYGPAPEDAKRAFAWLDEHDRSFGIFIGGDWRGQSTGSRFETINPANGQVIASIAQAGAADIDAAVLAAREAQPAWAALDGHGRARILYALARLVQRHSRMLSVLETIENGKPIRETRDIDIPLVARHFYYHAGWAQLLDSEYPGQEAIGVAGQIIPWNFPLLMLSWKIAPAIAAGNTVVLKPAEFTSLSALYFAGLCQEAGVPPGVINIVTGNGAVGEMIVGHSGIDKIAFTGSTEVGRHIRKATAGTGKKLTLELGGKSPFIVFDDADLDSAIEGLVDAIWLNQGQVCCAGSRLLVQESIADKAIAKLKARMTNLRVGNPLDKAIDIGAIVAPVQLQRIDALVRQGVDEGATLWQPDCELPPDGCFFPPSLFTDVTPSAHIAQEEIFGPVLVSMTFRTPAEAVALANNTRYGLAASIWTENINLALDIAPQLKAGVIWINSTNLFDASAGFGGYQESGFGREGGGEGMWEYLKPKFESRLTPCLDYVPVPANTASAETSAGIDRTAKMYIGGKQARPDSGYSRGVAGPDGTPIAEVGEGNRKDIRNAVEAARKAAGWGKATAHNRAQILYYIAENLEARAPEFAERLTAMTGATKGKAKAEVAASIRRLFSYGAWADKFEGSVHTPPMHDLTFAVNEPLGIIGIVCPIEMPLLGFVSLVAPAIAMGNRVVAVPSEAHPLSATDLYQVFDTSDVPGGVINIVTGARDELAKVLADHDEVDGIWYAGSADGCAVLEAASIGNIKRTWMMRSKRDWLNAEQGEGREFLRHATQVKNIWVPYGE
jgi:aldehyde dehydrogenase (NAD+)